jgi:hypothetical protein
VGLRDFEPEEKERRGPRVFVWVLGCAVLAFVLASMLLGPALNYSYGRAHQDKCRASLRAWGVVAQKYAAENQTYPYAGGDWEATTQLLESKGYLKPAERFDLECPANDLGASSFEGFKAPFPTSVAPATVIAWDRAPHTRAGEGRNVLRADLSVDFVTEAEFKTLLAEHDSLVNFLRAAAEPSK